MKPVLLAAVAIAAVLTGPAAFAADPPRPWQQIAQERDAAAAAQPPRYELQHMYDRHQNYAPHWVLVR